MEFLIFTGTIVPGTMYYSSKEFVLKLDAQQAS